MECIREMRDATILLQEYMKGREHTVDLGICEVIILR
jgi:hypothetical protein